MVEQGYNPNKNSAGRTLNGRCYNNRSYSFLYFWELNEVMAWLQWSGCFISVFINGRVGAKQSGGLWKVHEWRGKNWPKNRPIETKWNANQSPHVKVREQSAYRNGIPSGAVDGSTGLLSINHSTIQVGNVADFWFLVWFFFFFFIASFFIFF